MRGEWLAKAGLAVPRLPLGRRLRQAHALEVEPFVLARLSLAADLPARSRGIQRRKVSAGQGVAMEASKFGTRNPPV